MTIIFSVVDNEVLNCTCLASYNIIVHKLAVLKYVKKKKEQEKILYHIKHYLIQLSNFEKKYIIHRLGMNPSTRRLLQTTIV